MTTYQITSKAGVDFGQWAGETEAQALAAMHAAAGYYCVAGEDDVIFHDPTDAHLCGGVDDWNIDEA